MNLFFIIFIIVLFHLWCVVCDTTPPSREDLECAVCVLLIEELEGLASEVKSQEQIEQEIRNRICARLSGTLRQGCDTFVRFIPDLLSFLNNGVRPAQTCKTLQLCKQNWGELPPDGRPVNVYSIDLNQPAKTRWQAIVQRQPYFDNLWKLHYTLIELLHSEYVELLYGLGKQIFEIVPQPFKDELQGIADTTKLDIGFLVLLNLFYELKNGCTSVVAKDKQNQVFFSRNQDLGYGMGFTDLLRNQTIHVKFTRGKQVVHEIVTFAGYIGAPTGWLKDHFSIAVNARFYRGSIFTYIESVLEEFLLKKAHINTWVVREALMEQDNFESAVKRFSNTTLITDCYFIIGGVKNNEGVVIARDQEGPVYTRHLDDKQNWFLLETNYDQNEKPPFYDDRRPYALAAMHKYCNNGTDVTLNCLYQTLSTHPVLNLVSLYTAQAEANGLSVHHRTCHRRPGTANPDCVI